MIIMIMMMLKINDVDELKSRQAKSGILYCDGSPQDFFDPEDDNEDDNDDNVDIEKEIEDVDELKSRPCLESPIVMALHRTSFQH